MPVVSSQNRNERRPAIIGLMTSDRVLIVGAGMAGLACARVLNDGGVPATIFEASGRVGGRLGSESVGGFTLDRGFQIFLTSYPEARRLLDFEALALRAFTPGAIVRWRGQFHRLVDPVRRPLALPRTALSPLATLGDKMRVPRVLSKVLKGDLPHTTTLERLRNFGFSDRIIGTFFRPFFAGVFLEPDLSTSSRMFDFLYPLFATGQSALPSLGMQAIADQLASGLERSEIVTEAAVASVEGRSITFADGRRVAGRAVVVATDANTASRLLPKVPIPRAAGWTGTTCVYFAAERSPVNEPILVLNADGIADGPVNNVAVLSDVSSAYAPPGKSLIACTVIGDVGDVEEHVRQQMRAWYGHAVDGWQHLKTYRIPYALPGKRADQLDNLHRSPRVAGGVYLCGDHCDTASINGALCSGRRAAEAILADR